MGAADGRMYAFDASGSGPTCGGVPKVCGPAWSSPPFTPSWDAAPTVSDGTVFVSGTTDVYGFDATGIAGATVYVNVHGSISAFETTGTRHGSDRCLKDVNLCTALWQTAATPAADSVSGAPPLANGVLYAGGTSALRAYDAAGRAGCAKFPVSCEPLFSAPSRAYAAPVIVDGTLFFGSNEMLRAVYPAIKGADPAATVITGGTAPAGNEWDAVGQTEYAPTSWLLSLYDRGAQSSFDAVGHHPYSFPWNPLDEAGFNGFTQTRYLYLVMAAHGDGRKKVWGTEMGAPTGTVPLADPTQPCFIRSMTETEQAQWLHDYFLGWNTTFRAFTGPLIWKSTRDDPSDPALPASTHLWNYSGLLRLDHSPKPAFSAMQRITPNGVSGPALGGHCY